MLLRLMVRFNTTTINIKAIKSRPLTLVIAKISILSNYYKMGDLMWQDGLLIDFLQKKVVDKWIRRFLIYSSYLFSERILFEFVVRFYVDFVIWPLTTTSIFEFSNVSLTLVGLLSPMLTLVLVFNLSYLYTICL